MLIIEDDLPKHLKQSMFAHVGQYPVVCRYSSEPGDPGLDVCQKLDKVLVHIAYHFSGPHSTTSWLRYESLQRPGRDV